VACLFAIAAGLAYGALLYFQAGREADRRPVSSAPAGAQGGSGTQASLPSSVEADYRALWTRLTYAEKDVGEMHDILALTMIISALFGIALGVSGVNAWLSRSGYVCYSFFVYVAATYLPIRSSGFLPGPAAK
jgi:hypothetical protein